jgi:RNA polymerase sigma-70 factor (ECF subfamily)
VVAVSSNDGRDVVARARAGDRDAFGVLVDAHYGALLSSCRRMLGDADLARDAAQEATVRALLGLGSLRDDQRFGAWFVGIGLNVCRSWLTGTERRITLIEPGTAGLALATGGDDYTFDLVVARELASRVRAAVAELPTGQREAVIRFYLLGLTQAEVAAELNTGSGAVKTRLKKARNTLRKTLKDTHEETIYMSEQSLHQLVEDQATFAVLMSARSRGFSTWLLRQAM